MSLSTSSSSGRSSETGGAARAWLLLKVVFVVIYSVVFTEAYCRWLVPTIMIGPSFTMPDPNIGWTTRPSFSGRRVTREFDMHFKTGSQGFRGGDYHQLPDSQCARIISVGNSHAFGVGVNDDQTYAHILGSALREAGVEAEVINMAITDTGTGVILAKWKEICSYYPDVLIVRYDDYNYRAPGRLWRLQGDVLTRAPIEGTGRFRNAVGKLSALRHLESSALYGMARMLVSRHMSAIKKLPHNLLSLRVPVPRKEPDAKKDELEYRLLAELIDRCADADIPLVLATFKLKEQRRTKFNELTAAEHVLVLDLEDNHGGSGYYYKIDEHLNVLGHEYVADKLLHALLDWPRSARALSH